MSIVRWHRGALRRAAALNRGRKIGIYGGSFNPAHEGHLHVATEALRRLKLDEVWFLVSPGNPLKDGEAMAPFEKRVDSLLDLVGSHPHMKVCDYETQLGTRFTADTLKALSGEIPHAQFVWIMGADNFCSFEHWHKWQEIAKAVPIAVLDRSGYALKGFARGLGSKYKKYRCRSQTFKASQKPNWTFVAIPRHAGSATEIRARDGENWYVDYRGKET